MPSPSPQPDTTITGNKRSALLAHKLSGIGLLLSLLQGITCYCHLSLT
jgi:hypothetical protein